MKKILLLIVCCLMLTGCFNKDSMEDIDIYVAYYPIEYITTVLYENHSTIHSIYPDEADIYTFTLTDKQIKIIVRVIYLYMMVKAVKENTLLKC